jgi:hypothetical protein
MMLIKTIDNKHLFDLIEKLYEDANGKDVYAPCISSMKLRTIARALLSAKNNDGTTELSYQILRRIHLLSNKKLQFFNSSRINFIRKFFSALPNLFRMGKFQSSAYFAKVESRKMLDKLIELKVANQTVNKENLTETQHEEAGEFEQHSEHEVSMDLALEETALDQPILNLETAVQDVKEVDSENIQEAPLSLKEEGLLTIENFWSPACTNRKTLTAVLAAVLKGVEIDSYELIPGDIRRYRITYNAEKSAEYYGIQVTLKTKMEITLEETNDKLVLSIIPGEGRGLFCKRLGFDLRLDGVELAKSLGNNSIKMIIGNSRWIHHMAYPAEKMISTANALVWKA